MKVSEIMSGRVVSVGMREPVSAAARLLRQFNVGSLPVCDGQHRLRGGIRTVAPEDELDHAARVMGEEQIRRLPVVEDGQLVGVVSLCDMARAKSCAMEAGAALTEISANVRRK